MRTERSRRAFLSCLGSAGAVLLATACAFAATREVGPGKAYARIEDAVAAARPGDSVLVWPAAQGRPYKQVALQLRTARLSIRGQLGPRGERVRIDGTGYDYSGRGRIPRAIVQFDPGANECVLEGFELTEAHNQSHNGAGVRINQANHVTVRNCKIHGNDMGIMSGGDLAARTGLDQRIESCFIHANGSLKDPGYNHNLYLGGTSVTVRGCEISGALTGPNLKSRAHFNRVEYCWLHGSENRELDLVDDKGNTDAPGSHTILLGDIIVKKSGMQGNRSVIHFGQDQKGDHRGTVYLVHNTIVTPYQSAVLSLSAPGAEARFFNNVICAAGGRGRRTLLEARNGASLERTAGEANWLAAGWTLPASWDAQRNRVGRPGEAPAFADSARGDWRLKPGGAAPVYKTGLPWQKIALPAAPGESAAAPGVLQQWLPPMRLEERRDGRQPDLGACAAGP